MPINSQKYSEDREIHEFIADNAISTDADLFKKIFYACEDNKIQNPDLINKYMTAAKNRFKDSYAFIRFKENSKKTAFYQMLDAQESILYMIKLNLENQTLETSIENTKEN